MPSLSLAAGIAQGADAFVKSFLAARGQRNQMQLAKNQHLVEILLEQIRDPNTKYYQRAKMLDQIPTLLGEKTDQPLSYILGYDKLNEEDFADPNKPAIEGKLPLSGQTNEDVLNLAKTGQVTRSGEQQEGLIGQPQGMTKRGNLSPNDIAQGRKLQLDTIQNKNDIDKAAQIARINFDLQEKSYKANGFSKEIFRGYRTTPDGKKEFVVTMANSAGDKKDINLGDVEPEALLKARILKSASGGSTKLAQLMKANTIVQEYEADPTSHDPATYKAAKSYVTDFELGRPLKEATIESLGQKIEGTTPKSQSQIDDDERANEDRKRIYQKDYDDAKADEVAALATRESLAPQKTAAWEAAAKALERFENIKKGGAEPDDPEWKDAEADYNRKDAIARGLQDKYEKANEDYTKANRKATSAYERLTSSPSRKTSSNLTPRMRAMIAQAKKDNPGVTMPDEEWAAQIIAAGYK